MEVDARYMARALQLARRGEGFTSPNPMVGAVIVHNGTIIGEGYHRRFGQGHAEVNAVASVADKSLLADSTIYVTLEPCSHYGKTPPCARLIVDMGIPRVVVGCLDPNEKVCGRGIAMIRESGAEVVTGVMEQECRDLNRHFMTAHTLHRPFVLLKWAQSPDGFLDRRRGAGDKAVRFSSAVTSQQVHRLRSCFDAILVGSGTVLADDPRLDVRLLYGRSPRPVVIDRRGRIPASANVFKNRRTIYITCRHRDDLPAGVTIILCPETVGVADVLHLLFQQGITSVMVEGGAAVIASFVGSGLWDDARVEIAGGPLGPDGCGRVSVPSGITSVTKVDDSLIINVKNASVAGK